MKRIVPIGVVMTLLMLFFAWGCSDDSSDTVNGGDQLTDKSCIGCHSSQEMLEAALAEVSGSKVEVAIKSVG